MSKTKNKESFFWTSYSDLMTSLFFIMLVLFVLIVIVLHNKNKQIAIELGRYKADKETLEKIAEIQKQFKVLEGEEFIYLDSSQKFIAKNLVGEIFEPNEFVIKPEFEIRAKKVGEQIKSMLKKLSQNKEVKYQLVIEGNCANFYDHRLPKDDNGLYILSYKRALALYQFWQKEGIDLRKYNAEIQICGSGLNGEDRNPNEDYNKRFVIQILPKIRPFKQLDSK